MFRSNLRPLTFSLLLFAALGLAACGSSNSTTAPSGDASGAPSAIPTATVAGTQVARPSEQVGDTSGKDIGAIKCDKDTHDGGVSAKATLTIVAGGKSYRPSPNLGVLSGCSYWLHTDKDGNLIFSAPAGTAAPTLMDFFSVIRNASGSDPYVDFFASNVPTGKITVNGKDVTDSWGNIKITDGEAIVATAK